jgi:hypothetical protein
VALARTNKGSWPSTASYGTGSFASGSFTPEDTSLLVVVVACVTDTANDPSASLTLADSLGTLSWTPRVTLGWSDANAGGALVVWTAPITTGASMTLTADCGAINAFFYVIQAFTYTGYKSGTPFGATASNNNFGTDGAQSLTLSGTPDAASEVVGVFQAAAGSTGSFAVTQGSGWGELYDTGITDGGGMESQALAGTTSTSVPWQDIRTGTASYYRSMAIAFEVLRAASADFGGTLDGASESDVVTGGKTLLYTITGDTLIGA